MVRFSKLQLDAEGRHMVETNVRNIPQSAMQACPHFIMTAEHYRKDNTCRCNDPDHTIMHDWGYEWNNATQQWIAGSENDAA